MADASSFDHFSVRCVVLAPNPQVHTTIFVHGEEPPKPGWPHPWQDDQDQAGHALLERRRGNGTIYENRQIACAISTPSTTLRPRRCPLVMGSEVHKEGCVWFSLASSWLATVCAR